MSIFNHIKRFFAGQRESHPYNTDPEWNAADSIDPFNPFPEPVTIEITDVIDLHTIQPRDVKRVVEEYLEQVHEAGFSSVRIIHGKGIGVQREIVRTVLAKTPFVETWTDAPPEAGGLGATIVRLLT
jgi:dsDNA-specific endonuclease/ATPase MutS2